MPKGTKNYSTGAKAYGYSCPCGFRFDNSSLRDREMKFRLHNKICKISASAETVNRTMEVSVTKNGTNSSVAIDKFLKTVE